MAGLPVEEAQHQYKTQHSLASLVLATTITITAKINTSLPKRYSCQRCFFNNIFGENQKLPCFPKDKSGWCPMTCQSCDFLRTLKELNFRIEPQWDLGEGGYGVCVSSLPRIFKQVLLRHLSSACHSLPCLFIFCTSHSLDKANRLVYCWCASLSLQDLFMS